MSNVPQINRKVGDFVKLKEVHNNKVSSESSLDSESSLEKKDLTAQEIYRVIGIDTFLKVDKSGIETRIFYLNLQGLNGEFYHIEISKTSLATREDLDFHKEEIKLSSEKGIWVDSVVSKIVEDGSDKEKVDFSFLKKRTIDDVLDEYLDLKSIEYIIGEDVLHTQKMEDLKTEFLNFFKN